MRNKISPTIFIILISVCMSAENLIKNPGVEETNPKCNLAPAHYPDNIRKGAENIEWGAPGHTGKMSIKCQAESNWCTVKIPVDTSQLISDDLYRFSFWYKTVSDKNTEAVLTVNADGSIFPFGTSAEWTQTSLFFKGRSVGKGIKITLNGFDGKWKLKKDKNGKLIPNGKGGFEAENPLKITVWLDDFELRKAQNGDFKGNLLQNPDFESGNISGWWAKYGTGVTVIDNNIFHSGKYCLRMDCQSSFYSNFLPINFNEIYCFSIWMKSSLPSTPVIIRFNLQGTQGVDGMLLNKTITIGTKWKKYEFYWEPPQKKHYNFPGENFAICIIIHKKNTKNNDLSIWIDDVFFAAESF